MGNHAGLTVTTKNDRPGGSLPSAGQRNWRRVRFKIAAAGALACVAIAAGAYGTIAYTKAQIGPPPLLEAQDLSITVLDRNDRLLRPFTTSDGRWRLPVGLDGVDPRYVQMLFAFEDRRFYQHGGVDLAAIARAGLQMASNGRIVSGASTLTMQVARLLDQRHEKTAIGKVRQIARALQLEAQLSKKQILDLYLLLAPFGGNIEGVRAASLAYFGKEPKRLSVGQAALLVALPQSPEMRRPDRYSSRAKAARDRVLDIAVHQGVISKAEADRAKTERVPDRRLAFPMLAPHLSEQEVTARPNVRTHRLTLDYDKQAALETLAREQTKLTGAKLSSSILAIDHVTGEVIAHVGASDYLDQGRLGAIDMTAAVRSPGSTLKPFVYGLAFEAGLAHPETLIEDRPTRFGSYSPENFNETYRGTVTIREALGASLNVPAVRVLDAVGPTRLLARFRDAGFASSLPDGAKPSLAVALGGVGMTLHDLAGLYTALARGGHPVRLSHRKGERENAILSGAVKSDKAQPVLSPVASWYIADILKDAPPPANTRAGRIAYKTGTSYGYRDALAVGFDGRYTIAVWIGRADGTSTPGLVGRTAAAPILFDAFQRLSETRAPLDKAPNGAVVVSGSDLPPPLKRFGRDTTRISEAGPFLEPPIAISFPPDRAEVEIADAGGDGNGALLLKAEGGVLPFTWLVNGEPISSRAHRRDVTWEPDGKGFAKLSVIDAKGRVDRVTVRLK